jgi:hypothetical protein
LKATLRLVWRRLRGEKAASYQMGGIGQDLAAEAIYCGGEKPHMKESLRKRMRRSRMKRKHLYAVHARDRFGASVARKGRLRTLRIL